MKTKVILAASAIAFIAFGFTKQNIPQGITEEVSPEKLRTIDNKAFKAGEALHYRLHYGMLNAGTATLEVNRFDKKIAGREVYHIVGSGKSIGAFDWFFKVRDRYETFVDVDGLFPWMFVRDVSEGGYEIKQTYKFQQTKNKIDNGEGKTFEVPSGVQDMLSAFYYARAIDYTDAKKGEIFTVWSFVDDELWPLKIRYLGKDEVKVGGQKYKALKFCPVVQAGRLFKDEEDVSVWISDDENKIPLVAQGKVLIGSIKFELTKATGLANPLAKVE
ncbi:MAG: DUF3108 domain-containing protein [Flavobacteriales bacterium]|nr:DUF3108 domain-containing protein [Flavobacteriales bacterium]